MQINNGFVHIKNSHYQQYIKVSEIISVSLELDDRGTEDAVHVVILKCSKELWTHHYYKEAHKALDAFHTIAKKMGALDDI